MMKPVAGEAKMNRAEAHEPKSGHDAPAAAHKGKSGDAGSESKANMTGGFSSAVVELHAQHPHGGHKDYDNHHNDMSHVRHKPMRLG